MVFRRRIAAFFAALALLSIGWAAQADGPKTPASKSVEDLHRLRDALREVKGIVTASSPASVAAAKAPPAPQTVAAAPKASSPPPPAEDGGWKKMLDALSSSPGVGPLVSWFRERFQLVRFSLEGVFSISGFQNGTSQSPLEGGRASGVFAPALRLTEDDTLLFLYNGNYDRELQVFTEDEGPRQQSEEQRHELVILLAHDIPKPFGSDFIKRVTISPSFFQTYVFTRQTASEDWGNGIPFGGLSKFKGLYDYWDRGSGLEVKMVHDRPGNRQDTFTLAGQIYLRHYRNFISLARLQDPSSPEPKYEKDYIGYLGRATYEYQQPDGTAVHLSYTYLDRFFKEDRADKNPLQDTGIPGRRRRDDTHTFEWHVAKPVPWVKGLTGGLGGSLELNRSNSGFNDTLSPLSITGAFTEHYYDYWSFRVGPDFSYSRPVHADVLGLKLRGVLTLVVNYSYERRAYRSRKAKDDNGGFRDGGVGNKDSIEVDVTHVISPRLIYQVNPKWAIFFEYRRTIARSNFQDDRTFRYNYDINSYGLGMQYRF